MNRASHTKKNGVKDDFLALQTLTNNLVLFFRGLYLVSRPCIFTVFNLNEVYLPLVDIELLNSAYISAGLSLVWHLVQIRSGWRSVFFSG